LQHGFAQQRTPVVVVVETQQTHKNAASGTSLARSLGRRQVRAGSLGREEKKTNVADKIVTAGPPAPPLAFWDLKSRHLLFGT
jgi:hypothetical protein